VSSFLSDDAAIRAQRWANTPGEKGCFTCLVSIMRAPTTGTDRLNTFEQLPHNDERARWWYNPTTERMHRINDEVMPSTHPGLDWYRLHRCDGDTDLGDTVLP
jgi:hypothetical protein